MDDNQDKKAPSLGFGRADVITVGLKGAIGAIPVAGTLFSEIISAIIPNQRIDRLEDYVQRLNKHLEGVSEEIISLRAKEPDAIDVFEEGAIQSARAISNDRRDKIARLVAHGISGEERDRIEAKRLLNLLRQIDDDQLIMLCGYLHEYRNNSNFRDAHRKVTSLPRVSLDSTQEEVDRVSIQNLAKAQLESLGLLQSRYRLPKRGEMPELDAQTGKIKASSTDLTPIARTLLRRLGLMSDT